MQKRNFMKTVNKVLPYVITLVVVIVGVIVALAMANRNKGVKKLVNGKAAV
jgi:hypothetical protein